MPCVFKKHGAFFVVRIPRHYRDIVPTQIIISFWETIYLFTSSRESDMELGSFLEQILGYIKKPTRLKINFL